MSLALWPVDDHRRSLLDPTAGSLMSLSRLVFSHWKPGLASPTKEGGSRKWPFPKPDLTVGRPLKTVAFTTSETGLALAAGYGLDIRRAGSEQAESTISLKPRGTRNEAGSV